MKRLSLVLVIVVVMMSVLSVNVAAKKPAPTPEPVTITQSEPCSFYDEQDLVAGQYTVIGKVIFDSDGEWLTVQYLITEPGWSIPLSHLHVGESTVKNWAPGQFDYQHEHQGGEVYNYTYTVDIRGMSKLIVAAHCESEYYSAGGVDLDYEAAQLPSCVPFVLGYPGTSSYVSILVGDSVLAGEYGGWCADGEADINVGAYTGCVSSSYEYYAGTDPAIAGPLNYLINKLAPGVDWPTVQFAIWSLTGTVPSVIHDTAAFTLDVQAAGMLLAGQAAAEGKGYVPDCEENMAVILTPVSGCTDGQCGYETGLQPIIISVPVTCTEGGEGEETAWARGLIEFDKKWGWYSDFTCD